MSVEKNGGIFRETIQPFIKKTARLALPGLIIWGTAADCISHFISPANAEEPKSERVILTNIHYTPIDGEYKGGVSILSLDQVIDYSAPDFVAQCSKFSHPVGQPNISLAEEEIDWEIDYLPDIAGAKEQASDPNFQRNLGLLANDGSEVYRHFWGTKRTDVINPIPIKAAKNSTDYSDSYSIMYEAASRNSSSLVYANDKYIIKGVIFVGNQDLYSKAGWGSWGAMGNNYGIFIIQGRTVVDYPTPYTVENVVHEQFHGEGQDHVQDENNYMFPAFNRFDTKPKKFNFLQAALRCGGGRAFISAMFNGFIPTK